MPGLVTVKQVHGTEVLFVNTPSLDGRGLGEGGGYDILLTDRPGLPIGIKTADCLPILMVEPEKNLIAAIHAGWRGTLARVVEKAVQALCEKGGQVENLAVALGPCIGKNCYEVGEEVASGFEKEFPGWPILKQKSDDKWLLDLSETNRQQLLQLGMKSERIDTIDLCTHCRPDLFYSYRRDKEGMERMVSVIQRLSLDT